MDHNIKIYIYAPYLKATLFLLLLFIASHLHASNLITLTQQEKQFLSNHPTIMMGSDSGWAPYVINDKNGVVSGYDADVLSLINDISGANFTLTLGAWEYITEAQASRSIDGLSTAVVHKQFSEHSLFSTPYISLEKIIFTRKDFPYPVNQLSDLRGKKFGIYKANKLARSTAEKIKNVQIVEFENTQSLIEGITTGKADFMLGNGAMYYLLNKAGNPFLKPAIFLHNDPLDLVFVMRNDFPEAISIINKSLQAIGNEKLLELKEKWFSSAKSDLKEEYAKFSKQELTYLTEKKQLNLCIDPDWMPLEKLEKGQHIGISADYYQRFQENIDIPFNLVQTKSWVETLSLAEQRECDIVSLATPTENRKRYLNFTAPLIKAPLVLVTKDDVTFMDDLAFINNKKVAIINSYATKEIIQKQFPNLVIVGVNSAQQGLQMVVDGESFGYIDTLASVGYMFQTQFIGELKVSGKMDQYLEMSIATRNDEPLLLTIMDKLIKKIPESTHQQIINNYVAINYKQGIDYRIIWQVLFIISCLAVLFLFRYYTVKKYNRRIERHLSIIDNNVLAISFNIKGDITDVSHALCQLSGYKKKQLIGQSYNLFYHPKTKNSVYKSLWATIKKGNLWQGELLNLNKDGSSFWSNTKITPINDRKNNLKGYTVILQDISDKKRLEKIAITDPLTQIPNRLFINTSFNNEFQRSKRYQSDFSLILIDVDDFKKVNDKYGHKTGDDVLINLALILKQNIRQLDKVARWGGEEFLIICPETREQKAFIVAEKMREIIEDFEFSPHFKLTCSFGVAQSQDSDNNEALFQRVDNALYEAKEAGRNQVKLG